MNGNDVVGLAEANLMGSSTGPGIFVRVIRKMDPSVPVMVVDAVETDVESRNRLQDENGVI